MAFKCCLAGVDRSVIPLFKAVFSAAGLPSSITSSPLDVTELGRLAPGLLVCDVDATEVDPLELLRRIRFVLPECLIAVYTDVMMRSWSVECHIAGVNCMLSKDATETQLATGVHDALQSGCYTDPRFVAA